MKLYFIDKSEIETEIITDILYSEGIRFQIERHAEVLMPFIIGEVCDIACYTDYEHFEYVKYLFKKAKKRYTRLERCFSKRERKNVQRVSKKITTDTDNRH